MCDFINIYFNKRLFDKYIINYVIIIYLVFMRVIYKILKSDYDF